MTKQLSKYELYKTKSGLDAFITQYEKKQKYLYKGYYLNRAKNKVIPCAWDKYGKTACTSLDYKKGPLDLDLSVLNIYWIWKYPSGRLGTILFDTKGELIDTYSRDEGRPTKLTFVKEKGE